MFKLPQNTGITSTIFALVCASTISLTPATTRANEPLKRLCVDLETKLGYRGFKHCEYHELYRTSFKDWNCQCFSGQCRPTEFRVAAVTGQNETGLEVFINGEWFPIPQDALRKERTNMSPILLEWMAHACANDPVFSTDGKRTLLRPPHIECVWINAPS